MCNVMHLQLHDLGWSARLRGVDLTFTIREAW
jgi:hypothetical protein